MHSNCVTEYSSPLAKWVGAAAGVERVPPAVVAASNVATQREALVHVAPARVLASFQRERARVSLSRSGSKHTPKRVELR